MRFHNSLPGPRLLAALLLTFGAAATVSAQTADSPVQAADSLGQTPDSARAGVPPDTSISALLDSLRAEPAPRDSVRALSGAAAARLDSAAVAALSDTTDTVGDAFGDGMPVRLFGKTLFNIWGGLGDFTPSQRAERLSARLEDLARNRDVDPERIRVIDGNDLTTISVGEVILMSVTDDDGAARGITREEAAVEYRLAIVEGVLEHREQATIRGVLEGIAWSALALVLLLLSLRALGAVFRWLDTRTKPARDRILRPIRIGTLEVVGRAQVSRIGRGLVGLFRLALSLILLYTFLTFVFGQFVWTQTWSENLLGAAISPLESLAEILISSVDNVVAIGVVIVVMRWIIRLSDYLFLRVARGEAEIAGFHADLADPTRKIAKFLLFIVSLMLIYPYTPIANNKGFQGLTVFFGLLLSLGSSTAISNMVAGVVLTYTRAFRIGDRVRVGEAFGDVIEKSFLVTRIRTTKNEDISVPNANVLSNQIVNYSAMAREGSGVILHTEITIGYDVPWPRVHGLLAAAALQTAGIEKEPSPFVLQRALGDFSVAYELNAYTKEVGRMARIYSEIHQHVQDGFAEAGIEILSPTYEARRDGPSTLPDLGELHDARARNASAATAGATDGADAAELDDEELPEPVAPALLGMLGGGTTVDPKADLDNDPEIGGSDPSDPLPPSTT